MDRKPKEELELELPYNFIEYISSTESNNMQTLCRICLSFNNAQLFPLFKTQEDDELPQIFKLFTSITIHPNDTLPSSICEGCRTQVISSYEFKMKCLKSDFTLRTLITGEVDTISENITEKQLIPSKNEGQYVSKLETETEIEPELKMEDIQYLEDFDENDSENEALHIVQKTNKCKKKGRKSIQSKKKNKVSGSGDIKHEVTHNTKENIILSKSIKKSTSKTFECQLCSTVFPSRQSLGAHTLACAGAGCVCACGRAFRSAHDLGLHAREHQPGPVWTCVCDKTFTSVPMFRRHIERHMQWKRHSCGECGKLFAERYALQRHARVHTGQHAEKRHQCHLCDKRYSVRSLLSAHLARHSGARPCECARCGKAFPSARLLASHRRVHDDRKPHACHYCDKRFRHESTRNTHHRTHTGERPYVCAACGKTFIQNSNLTLHMRTHTGEKPYKCSECGREFSSGSSLKSHVLSHSGEKPYSCPVCGKKFGRAALSSHVSLHAARAHRCELCPRAFSRAARLRDHRRTHTGEKPFECNMCPQKYATKSHLVKHMKTHVVKKKGRKQDANVVKQVEPTYVVPENTIRTKELSSIDNVSNDAKDLTVEADSEVPLEVSNELILQDDSDMKSELIVVDDSQATDYQNDLVVNDLLSSDNYGSNMNLVTVNEEGVSISASSATLEGTTVKLYQLDQSQSLLQIHSVAGQVTISKITSKMTANF